MKTRLKELDLLIGNTPMVGINYSYKGKSGVIYAKCEHYNLTGSIKDRMALYILKQAYQTGAIKPGDTIVEATSGNTGIAFSAIGRLLGHKVRIIMPDWMSMERKMMIQSYGAEIIPISKEEGGFLGSIRLSEEMAAHNSDIFLPCQFSNCDNYRAHEETTGPEIVEQLKKEHLHPDAFIAGVGTGGTVVGVGKALRKTFGDVKVHPLEPEESPTISTGYKVGNHRIQGISDEFIPKIFYAEPMDEVVAVSDGDSILMAQKLASTLGLAVGISSGANLIGAIKLQQKYGKDAVVTTVFADCNKKYLSTDLMKTEPVKPHYLAPDVTLDNCFCIDRAW
ncbi:MAG: PLP-dependent cysteine synthase family protein [Dysgonamonadaceae bacterium]|jgi:cysteine synthase A|nr:PLP-dependent cysteine synthase family protein [Dysgonamonadaceae bacterium]